MHDNHIFLGFMCPDVRHFLSRGQRTIANTLNWFCVFFPRLMSKGLEWWFPHGSSLFVWRSHSPTSIRPLSSSISPHFHLFIFPCLPQMRLQHGVVRLSFSGSERSFRLRCQALVIVKKLQTTAAFCRNLACKGLKQTRLSKHALRLETTSRAHNKARRCTWCTSHARHNQAPILLGTQHQWLVRECFSDYPLNKSTRKPTPWEIFCEPGQIWGRQDLRGRWSFSRISTQKKYFVHKRSSSRLFEPIMRLGQRVLGQVLDLHTCIQCDWRRSAMNWSHTLAYSPRL